MMLPPIAVGLRTVPGRVMHPMTCLCKQVQTTAYEIVNGSYIPNHDSKLDSNKVSVFLNFVQEKRLSVYLL